MTEELIPPQNQPHDARRITVDSVFTPPEDSTDVGGELLATTTTSHELATKVEKLIQKTRDSREGGY